MDKYSLLKLQDKSDALDQLLQQHHFILDNINNNVIIVNKAGIIKVWNKAIETFSGISVTEAVGSDIRLMNERSKLKNDPLVFTLETGKEIENKKIKIKINNTYHELVTNTKLIRNSQNEILGALKISTDVTDIRRNDKILEQNERLASVSQLAAGLAHEIRNPLTSVRGFLQLLQDKYPDNKDYFDIMLNELDRTNKLISDFLMLAKPSQTKIRITNINCLLKEIMYFMKSQAILNDVEIIDLVTYTPYYVNGDKEQLKQVFINLVRNAIESIESQGIIRVFSQCVANEVFISVEDTGQGIPDEIMPRIFDVLYSSKDMGTGLGLSLCKQIIERHKGRIEVTSTPGKGSTFKVYLPIVE